MAESAAGPKISPAMLRDVGLFGGLSSDALQILADELPCETAEPGRVVVREGETAKDMYVVLHGEVEVVKDDADGNSMRVALFGPGDWFGEMAILDVQPRSASVRALAPSLLLRFGAEEVDRLLYRKDMKSYALFVMNIARELSRRLRVADGILAQISTAAGNYPASKKHPPSK